jgi:hypothetical protein
MKSDNAIIIYKSLYNHLFCILRNTQLITIKIKHLITKLSNKENITQLKKFMHINLKIRIYF